MTRPLRPRASFPARFLDGCLQDLRVAVRVSRRTPMVTGLAVLALALGIGANTAVFSVIKAVLLPPLDYAEADELVQVQGRAPTWRGEYPHNVMADRYFDYRDQTDRFDQLVAVSRGGWVLEGTTRYTNVVAVGNGFFSMFGIEPMLGRTLSPSPDVQSAPAGVNPEMMLSFDLWQSRFGSDSTVIGQSVVLDHWGREDDAHNVRTIVGVLPAEFEFPSYRYGGRVVTVSFGAVLPLMEARWFRSQRNAYPFTVFGRLSRGSSLEQARTQLQRVSDRLSTAYPDEAGYRVVLTRLSALPRTVYGQALMLLWGVVAAVLLIACLNVACLMLARSAARDGEFAVRASLGGTQGRLSRQLLTESLLVAASGAVVGVLLAWGGTRAVLALFPGSVPGLDSVAINGPVILVTLLISLLSVVFFGWAPPLLASRVNLTERLKGIRGGVSIASGRLLGALVAAEVALALVLFAGAGLFLNSFLRLTNVETGFEVENVLAVTVGRAPRTVSRYGSRPDQVPLTALHAQVREAAESLPGVGAVAIQMGAVGLPFSRYEVNHITVEDRHRPGELDDLRATWTNVDPRYFEVLNIPLLAGRTFSSADASDGELVTIVSESAAHDFWPGADPLGKRLTFGHQDLDRDVNDARYPLPRMYTVVGVVGDVVSAEIERGPELTVYTPLTQSFDPGTAFTVLMRPSMEARALAERARAAILAVDEGELSVRRVTTMRGAFGAAVAQPRFYTLLLGLLAAAALVLVLAGVYGVVAYLVRRRTHELGIRMALGAPPAQVQSLIIRQGMLPVASGVALGVAGSLYAGPLLTSYLFVVQPGDPLTIGVTGALVTGMAVVACYVPARKAARVDPSELLRTE